MASGSISDTEYVCTLDEKSAKKAKDELNEDPKNRLGAVETFRQWILQQPHIKCPTDTAFLLPFLRVRYFGQLAARELLENFMTRRTNYPHWFRNLDPGDPKIQAVYDSGYFLLLPEKDDDGRLIYFIRPGRLDLGDKTLIYNKTDFFRAFACLIDYIHFLDEGTTVNGTVVVGDFGGYSLRKYAQVPADERRSFMQTWQGSYPARVKQGHVYNTGTMVEIVLNIAKACMPEKIQQRIKVHGQSLEDLYQFVPKRLLPLEYLPDDYNGPNAETEGEIIERMKSLLLQAEVRSRIQYLSNGQFGIDDKKRPIPRDGTDS